MRFLVLEIYPKIEILTLLDDYASLKSIYNKNSL